MPPRSRRNRILMALIAAWMAISLAIGGAGADQASGENATATTESSAAR